MPLDAKQDVGGSEEGFQPIELFAIGLAGCTGMDVISIMTKKRQAVTNFEVQVHAERAEEHPKVITSAVIEYFVTGTKIDEAALTRSLQLSAQTYCPAQAMLGRIMPIELKYHIYEVQDDGQRTLVKSGEYHPTPSTQSAA
jgi:putative redox protein